VHDSVDFRVLDYHQIGFDLLRLEKGDSIHSNSKLSLVVPAEGVDFTRHLKDDGVVVPTRGDLDLMLVESLALHQLGDVARPSIAVAKLSVVVKSAGEELVG